MEKAILSMNPQGLMPFLCAASSEEYNKPAACFLHSSIETEEMMWILDLKGANRKCFPPKAVCKEALNIFYTHYPER